MKKTLSIILSILLVATLFVACSSSPSSRPKEDLDFFAQHAGMYMSSENSFEGTPKKLSVGSFYDAITNYKGFAFVHTYKNTKGVHSTNDPYIASGTRYFCLNIGDRAYMVLVDTSDNDLTELKDVAVEILKEVKNQGGVSGASPMYDILVSLYGTTYDSKISFSTTHFSSSTDTQCDFGYGYTTLFFGDDDFMAPDPE